MPHIGEFRDSHENVQMSRSLLLEPEIRANDEELLGLVATRVVEIESAQLLPVSELTAPSDRSTLDHCHVAILTVDAYLSGLILPFNMLVRASLNIDTVRAVVPLAERSTKFSKIIIVAIHGPEGQSK